MRRAFLLLLTMTAPAAAQAPAADGRLLGHFPYPDSTDAPLQSAPHGFAIGQPCRLQPAVIPDLARLLAAEAASGTPGRLHGVSCYRSIEHQRAVFCGPRHVCRDPADRARQVAPPGFSEHETGYAIDFGVRPAPRCPDTDECIARTPAGQWLLANAARFGFELSFPAANAQGVSWEPWHWRWVGVNGDRPEAAGARALFGTARTRFPANPAVPPLAISIAVQPPFPLSALPAPKQPPRVKLPKADRG